MAASALLVSRRAAAVNKLRPSAVAALSRSFTASTSVAPSPGTVESSVAVPRRRDAAPVPRRHRSGDLFPTLGDALDPFNPRRSLMDVFNMVDQMLDFPFGAGRGTAGGAWRGWDAREDDKALYLKVEMPGLGKDDVQLMVENNTLVIKGEAAEEGEEGGEVEQGGDEGRERGRRRYSSRIELPENEYELGGVKAEMKNGVLRVVVPKVKPEERKDVRHVSVE
ncbi:small heat shock protein, chloroplastic-like [Zingiber officinale]|uniref:small heat shock protein, chloroplastic-like n=1 Tax=Zingiber officinale TaxID=94328 RepID=UPI001C4AF11B|nr:small heat shock protein, chloroplastic-like [Zingiber officinale]